MKIAQIGSRFKTIPQISFFSTQTFLEYDALIISSDDIVAHSRNQQSSFFEKRKSDLIEFISFKKIPIIYLAPTNNELTFIHSQTYVSKTLDVILPIKPFKIIEETGRDFQILSKNPFADFLEKYKSWFGYYHFFSQCTGTPIACTTYTEKTLAFYNEDSIFLPNIVAFKAETEKEFLSDLLSIAKKVRFDAKGIPLPQWTELYSLPEEDEIKRSIAKMNEQINQLTLDIETAKNRIEKIIEKKRIFTASGNELEFFIEAIFRDLGFEILQSDKNRDDLIVKYDEEIAIVEIKGLSNSAGEKNAAQLEKWRTIYLEKNGINPKGVLLVNTFKDTPLVNRSQTDFPDQMIKYSVGREHCLITTIQLLTIYYSIIANPESKDTVIKSIFDTVGRYNSELKWQDFIRVDKSQ